MDMLFKFWPVLVLALLIVLIVRRIRGEPLDTKDAAVTPLVLLTIGTTMIAKVGPTTLDLAWLIGLSAVSLGFGAARSATVVIDKRDGRFVQRYRWQTFALLVASLVVAAVLGMVAQRFGMHEEARPLTFTIGIGLAGEGLVTLVRAARRGVEMPWKQLGRDMSRRILDRR